MRFLWGRSGRPVVARLRCGNSGIAVVAGLGLALALPVAGWGAASGQVMPTETMLSAQTHGVNQATVTARVIGHDGLPAQGAVVISDEGRQLAGMALRTDGTATTELVLTPGAHNLTASYAGDAGHASSASEVRPVAAVTGTAPDFSIAVSPATITLTQGQSGTVTASVTPVNGASLTAPMFVTLSCSGLPDQASCTFTPENLEILPNATAAVVSSLDLATAAASGRLEPLQRGRGGLVWCILLPGTLGLGLAFGARRRWLSRMALLGLVGLIAVLGTTACSPLYYYHNHGPSQNLPTPAGTYTLLVTAQSSNGITATTHSTTMVLTVQ